MFAIFLIFRRGFLFNIFYDLIESILPLLFFNLSAIILVSVSVSLFIYNFICFLFSEFPNFRFSHFFFLFFSYLSSSCIPFLFPFDSLYLSPIFRFFTVFLSTSVSVCCYCHFCLTPLYPSLKILSQ